MASIINELRGIEKASVLMLSLGAERSAKVFDHLTPGEREMLGAEIVKLRHVDALTRQRVLDEVNEIVKRGLAPVSDGEAADSGGPLKWLENLDPREVAEMLIGERPRIIALALAHISPRAAAGIMTNLSENSRNQVALRLAAMKPAAREAVDAVDEAMRKKRSEQTSTPLGSTPLLRRNLKSLLGRNLKSRPNDTEARRFASPEDIVMLSDSEIKDLVAAVGPDDIRAALTAASDEARSAVLRNMSEEEGLAIRKEMASSARVRLVDLEQAQRRIVEAMRRFGEAVVE